VRARAPFFDEVVQAVGGLHGLQALRQLLLLPHPRAPHLLLVGLHLPGTHTTKFEGTMKSEKQQHLQEAVTECECIKEQRQGRGEWVEG